ncbi:MAG: recombination protein RecR [Bacteroidales bacterium]|nr:recombination protein RecR [Bacteroidales bacterium]MBQ7458837.1 recombination protein RecR [Bacteroidales bacterium]
MYKQNYRSKLLEDAVEQIASLPGVGRKSALRYALHLLHSPAANVEKFTSAIARMRTEVRYCPECNMISDEGVCPICSDNSRDRSIVCVVESLRDVLSIENTGQYHGLYHVLGGVISPMDGVGPDDLPIKALAERVGRDGIVEVIMALDTDMEGETTALYIYRQLASLPVKVSTIARGVAFGDDLEYTDEFTLGKAIVNRQLFSI